MFGLQRFQVLDLGSHVVKALIGGLKNDGTLVVESVCLERLSGSSWKLDEYLAEIHPVLEKLARKFFRKSEPVHVLPADSIVRSEVHALPGVDESQVPKILITSRRHFLGSFGTRVPIYEKSFPVNIQRQDEQVHVTAVHSYCRRPDVDLIIDALKQAQLKVGSILSPVLALSELAGSMLAAAGDAPDSPRLLVNVGATSTALLLLNGATVSAYRKLYAGSTDWTRRLVEDAPEVDPSTTERITEALVSAGLDRLAETLAEAGLPEEFAAKAQARVLRSWDEMLDALNQALPELLKTREVEEDELEPEQPEAPGLQGPIVFSGGGAALEGFVARAQLRLGVPCALVDPFAVSGAVTSGKLSVPPAALTSSIGALIILARSGAQGANIAEEALASASRPEEKDRSVLAAVRRPLWLGGALAAVLGVLTLLYGMSLEADVKEISDNVDVERAAIPPQAEIQKTLQAYRDLRQREVTIDARFAYLAELLKNRFAWHQLFNVLDSALPKNQLAVTSVEVGVAWPNTGEEKSGLRRTRMVSFKLKGDARAPAGVTQFVQALKVAPIIKDSRIAGTRQRTTAAGTAGSAYSFEIVGEIDDAQTN